MRFILLVACSLYSANAVFYKSNTTDLDRCDVHYAKSGSVYKDFYNLPVNHNTSYILDFHFGVMASSDAHILLASSADIEKDAPVYEIVIGAGGNTFCDIRRMQKSEVKASVRIKGLLSGLDPHFFWLHISKDGLIEVGVEGNSTSFISWSDPDPLSLKVFSFSTWSGIEAKWFYNCDRSGNWEELEKKMTTLEKLRRDLLTEYDPVVRPVMDMSTVTTISMSIVLTYLNLNEYESTIDFAGETKLIWHDEKLKWNAENYDHIRNIHIFRKEIWQPHLICLNAVDHSKDILEDSMMVAHNTGLVEWSAIIRITAWCENQNLKEWPRDSHICQVYFLIPREPEFIKLEFDYYNSSMTHHQSSEWLVLEAALMLNFSTETLDPPAFVLSFTVKRSSTIYNTVFFTPFLVIATSLLLSFWLSPFGHMKISLGCAAMLMGTIMLIAMAIFVPNSSKDVPYLLSLYCYSFIGGLMSLIIAVVVINLSRNKHRAILSHVFCNILTSKVIKGVLFLPNIVMPDEYGELNQVSKDEDKNQCMWILLGVVIDRVAFLVFLILISYATGIYVASKF
ncbi:acetylcholine receptor subunit alpha-like [Cylas formicarius]|uniref:acetylcholine receptor subunit alpha-like n=1 Tax=Cylas formicarius TaxID=197179 RepID=UPI00295885ED|nr:acetylcholine receptor subunit alpha-like [Cylas formicarius]